MKEEILNEYLLRVEESIKFNDDMIALTLDEQLQLLNDCKVLINELRKQKEMTNYYKSEYVNVAIYWKDERLEHRKTKVDLKNLHIKYKEISNKYFELVETCLGGKNENNL